jgi:hypothetical protein
MTFPTVVATNVGNSGVSTAAHAINMPASISVGDLLLVAFCNDDVDTVSITSGTDWAQLFSTSNASMRLSVYWKIATGSGDNLTLTTSGSEGTAHISYRITGHAAATDPECGTTATGSSTSPDPPSLNPSAWDAEDTLWIAVYGWDGHVANSAYPTSYDDNQLTERWANASGSGVAMATRELNASSDDPGVGTIGSEEWAANTIAIRPAVTGGGGGLGIPIAMRHYMQLMGA